MPGYARPTNIIPSQEITFTPSGNISSTSVQGAIEELDLDLTTIDNELFYSSSAPPSPTEGALWIDNADPAKPILKVYDGTSWVIAGSSLEVDEDQIILATRMFA